MKVLSFSGCGHASLQPHNAASLRFVADRRMKVIPSTTEMSGTQACFSPPPKIAIVPTSMRIGSIAASTAITTRVFSRIEQGRELAKRNNPREKMGYGDGHIKNCDKSYLMHGSGDFFFLLATQHVCLSQTVSRQHVRELARAKMLRDSPSMAGLLRRRGCCRLHGGDGR